MSAAAQPCEPRADGYARREPEATLLYPLVREHWPVFLERAEEQGGLPRFVVRDPCVLATFLDDIDQHVVSHLEPSG